MINSNNTKKVNCIVLISFFICLAARFFEYFVLKTDQTVLGENVWHKIFGIVVLICLLRFCRYTFHDIGITSENALKYIGYGLLIGTGVYGISYAVEFVIYMIQNENPAFAFYVESFSVDGNTVVSMSVGFVMLCILMNIINVLMEEGIFRGFYDKLLSEKYSFWIRTLIVAALFGVWHITMTIRSYLYGYMSLSQTIFMTVGYIILAGLMSIKWAMLKKMCGTIWIGMGEHFFNNTVVNLLHITTVNGTDNMQIIRVMLANFISFSVVAVVYYVRKQKS